MPATTIRINGDRRNGVYELIRNHIGSVGELLHEGNFVKAERLSLEFEEDFSCCRTSAGARTKIALSSS